MHPGGATPPGCIEGARQLPPFRSGTRPVCKLCCSVGEEGEIQSLPFTMAVGASGV